MQRKKKATDDARVVALAELAGIPIAAAMGIRSLLWELVLDVLRSPDLSNVPAAQWALTFAVPKDHVHELITALIDSGFLKKEGDRLLLAGWEEANADTSHAAFRRWLRSKPGAVARLEAALRKDSDPS